MLSHSYLWCPRGIFNLVFLATIHYLFLKSPTNPTCPPHLTLIHFVTMRLSTSSTHHYFKLAQHQITPNINQLSSAHLQCKIFDTFIYSFIHSFLFHSMNPLEGLTKLSDLELVIIHYNLYWYINLIYT